MTIRKHIPDSNPPEPFTLSICNTSPCSRRSVSILCDITCLAAWGVLDSEAATWLADQVALNNRESFLVLISTGGVKILRWKKYLKAISEGSHTFFRTNFCSRSEFLRLCRWGDCGSYATAGAWLCLGRRLPFATISFFGSFEGLDTVACFLVSFHEHGNLIFNFIDCCLALMGICLLSLAGVQPCKVSWHPSICVIAVVLEDTCRMWTLYFCRCPFITFSCSIANDCQSQQNMPCNDSYSQ